MARIVVCGYMIRHPLAGNLFAFFHYVLGLRLLGHEVLYLEESGWPGSCYDPVTGEYGDDPATGLRLVRELLAECGVDVPVCYVDREAGRVEGVAWGEVKRMLGEADMLLNIGGICWLPEFRLCRCRVLVDMDPLFTQLGRFGSEGSNDHHLYFSYGGNIGRPGCTIPTRGIDWIPTAPPVVPEIWRRRAGEREGGAAPRQAAFTTVANWSAYDAVTDGEQRYGQKDEEFLRLLDLPRHTTRRLELALAGVGAGDAGRLRAAGWSIRNAGEVSVDVRSYQDYITGSRGEFSAAKHGYVQSRSGWFSDRSVCYLAAGLPVILQDTGYSEWLPAGRGVLPFSSLQEAVESLERVNAEYGAHCEAARDIGERVFSYQVVLPRLLEAGLRVSMG